MNSQVVKSRHEYIIGELIDPVEIVCPDTLVRHVKEVVGEEDPINAVVVVDGGRPGKKRGCQPGA